MTGLQWLSLGWLLVALAWGIYLLAEGRIKPSPKIRPEIQMLIDLVEAGRDWHVDRHVWFHPSGVSIWVANCQIGYQVKWGASSLHDYSCLSDAGPWRLTSQEYKAMSKVMAGKAVTVDAKSVADVAANIVRMYGKD